MSVNNVALISPATTVMAIGVRISAPSPNPRAHRQKTQNGGCSRHQDGSEVDRAGLHNRIHLLQRLRLGIFDILVVRAVRGQGLLRPAQQRKALAGDPSGISPSPRLAANLIARSISSGVNLPPGP